MTHYKDVESKCQTHIVSTYIPNTITPVHRSRFRPASDTRGHDRGGSVEAAGASSYSSSLSLRAKMQRLGAGDHGHVEQAGLEVANDGHLRPHFKAGSNE